MRPIWKGHVSFGLVSVPVSLYSASERGGVSFRMLHKEDNSPVQYKRFCQEEDREVPKEEIVKGYPVDRDQYIVLDDEDFEKAEAAVELSKTINIVNFTKADDLDPLWFDRPYFLEAREGGETAYELLRQALEETNYVGVCKFVLRNREHLGSIIPYDGVLLLELLRFKDELRSHETLQKTDNVTVDKKQLELAKELINKISGDFHYEEYQDEYSAQLKEIIRQKAEGKKVAVPKPKKGPEIKGLMDALEKSLQAA